MSTSPTYHWSLPFLLSSDSTTETSPRSALIVLNQPFSKTLLLRLWNSCELRCCADGGANRLYDTLLSARLGDGCDASILLPDFVKGDLDSIREDVLQYYSAQGVPVIHDSDQYSTDLMKCIATIEEKETADNLGQYDLIILGGLEGRLDQTIHTLQLVHKLRKTRHKTFVVTDDNVAWVLDEGEHIIEVDHSVIGPTCGLLPVGISSTILTTTGLQWNLNDTISSFDGLVSTSNALVPSEHKVWIKTTQPIWWTAALRPL